MKKVKKSQKQVKQESRKFDLSVIHNFFYPVNKRTRLFYDLLLFLPLLIILIDAYSVYKVDMMKMNPGFDSKKDNGLFWSETAYQYRYAKMFADGDPKVWETLSNDKYLQYPDGVKTWNEYTTFMEPVHGIFYKWFVNKGVPFHIYLMWFVAIFSSFLMLILYAGVRLVWKSPPLAFITALMWVLMPGSFFRQVSNIYLKEDFSIVFIILFILLFLAGLKDTKKWIPIAGAISLFIALTSWHFSQFMFLLFAGCVFISYFTTKDWQEHYTRNLIYYTIAGIAAGLVPVLWQRSYIVSNPMLICYALLITIFTKKWWSTKLPDKWWSRFLVPFVLLLVFSTTNFVFNTGLKEYAHVFQLLYYKIIFLGEIPKNPAALPFDARIFWTGNFEGMTLKDFSENFGSATFLLLLIPAAFIVDMILKKRGIQEVFIFFLFIGSMIASILVSRLVIFLTVFTAVGAGLFLFLPERFLQKKDDNIKHKSGEKYLLPILLTLAAYIIVLIPMFMNFQTMKALKPQIDEDLTDRRALFAWINENTKPDDAILSSISDGPMILLYTGRPVILNSQFENSYIRRRTEEFNAALFGSEQDLYNFCLKYDAKYIALANKMVLPTGPGSNRYNACVDDKLPASSAAALINFYPETMTKFSPVYDNNNYRVMRVLYDYDKKITKRVCDSSGCIDQVVYDSDKKEDFTWERGYSSYYDPSLFRREGDFYIGTAETMKKLSDESKIMQDMGQYYGEIMNILQRSRGKVNPSDKVAIENNLDIIRRNVQRALQINPKDFTCYMNLGMLEAQVGNMDKAFDNLSKALEIAPTERELLGLTFDLLGKSKNYDKIMTLGNNLLQKDPESVFILYHLADASLNSQNYAQAYEYANKSINIVNAKKLNLERNNIVSGTLYFIRGVSAYNLKNNSVARTDLAEYLKTATSPQLKASAEKILSEIKVE